MGVLVEIAIEFLRDGAQGNTSAFSFIRVLEVADDLLLSLELDGGLESIVVAGCFSAVSLGTLAIIEQKMHILTVPRRKGRRGIVFDREGEGWPCDGAEVRPTTSH